MLSLTITVLNPQDNSNIFHFTSEIWQKMWKISKIKMDRASAHCFLKFVRFFLKLIFNFCSFLTPHVISFTKSHNLFKDQLKSLWINYAHLARFTKFSKIFDVLSNWKGSGTVKKLMVPQFLICIIWHIFNVR
jgi:hypothetical protein